jgi:glutamate dehydrogenase
MAKTLTINTADIMGSYLEFTKLEEFPQYDHSIEFPKYEVPIDFADNNEPLDLPKYEEPVEFPKYEEFSEFDGSIAIMDISDTSRSPSSATNKLVDQVIRTPGRKPSPQPAHFSVPSKNGNGNGHRVLRSATVGYIAPEFKGKAEQMLQGKMFIMKLKFCSDNF